MYYPCSCLSHSLKFLDLLIEVGHLHSPCPLLCFRWSLIHALHEQRASKISVGQRKKLHCQTQFALFYRDGIKSGLVLLSKSQEAGPGRKFTQPRERFLAILCIFQKIPMKTPITDYLSMQTYSSAVVVDRFFALDNAFALYMLNDLYLNCKIIL